MFIAALLIITKRWKQRKCPSTSECIKKCDIAILFVNKKQWSTNTCYTILKPQKHFAQLKKLDTQKHILCDHLHEISENCVYRDRK